jgi:hypothetical protein
MTVKTTIALTRKLLANPQLARESTSNPAVVGAIRSVLALLETASGGNKEILALVTQVRGALDR